MLWYDSWEVQIAGASTRQAKSLTLDGRYVSCQKSDLVRVGKGPSDRGRETDSPFHAIPNVSRIIHILAVVVMGIDDSSDEAHFHDSILEAS